MKTSGVDTVQGLLLGGEQTFKIEALSDPIIRNAYEVGIQYSLTFPEMALLALPSLMNELRRLRENEMVRFRNVKPEDNRRTA